MPANGRGPLTALVLGGGGSRGAVGVGLYRALVELGIRIDLIVSSSIGAVNGALIAAGLIAAGVGLRTLSGPSSR